MTMTTDLFSREKVEKSGGGKSLHHQKNENNELFHVTPEAHLAEPVKGGWFVSVRMRFRQERRHLSWRERKSESELTLYN